MFCFFKKKRLKILRRIILLFLHECTFVVPLNQAHLKCFQLDKTNSSLTAAWYFFSHFRSTTLLWGKHSVVSDTCNARRPGVNVQTMSLVMKMGKKSPFRNRDKKKLFSHGTEENTSWFMYVTSELRPPLFPRSGLKPEKYLCVPCVGSRRPQRGSLSERLQEIYTNQRQLIQTRWDQYEYQRRSVSMDVSRMGCCDQP